MAMKEIIVFNPSIKLNSNLLLLRHGEECGHEGNNSVQSIN
jgi:hypothetical protein